MSQNITLTFALLFGASVALICAIYVALIAKNKRKSLEVNNNNIEYVQ